MNSAELRIGNEIEVIHIDYGKKHKIVDSDLLLDIEEEDEDVTYHYIPISESWLIDKGFEKELDGVFRIHESDLIEISFHGKVVIVSTQSVCLNHIEYIHQIQNLYYSLHGFEL